MKFTVHKVVRLDYKKKHLQETLQLPELFKQKRRLFSKRKKDWNSVARKSSYVSLPFACGKAITEEPAVSRV